MNEPIRNIFATEHALTEFADEGPFLILYRSKPHSVSIAYDQSLDDLDLEKCEEFGVDFSRRMTGGRAVYHNHMTDFSYAFITSDENFLQNGQIKSNPAYQRICEIPQKALAKIGVPTTLDENNFLKIDGMKISGSSMWWHTRKGSILQHGYVLMNMPNFHNAYTMIKSKTHSREERMKEAKKTSVSISQYRTDISEKDWDLSFEKVVDAFLSVTKAKPMSLELHHQKRIKELLEEKYGNDQWQKTGNLSFNKEKGDCIRGEAGLNRGAHIE